jgi:hypothetical protein
VIINFRAEYFLYHKCAVSMNCAVALPCIDVLVLIFFHILDASNNISNLFSAGSLQFLNIDRSTMFTNQNNYL